MFKKASKLYSIFHHKCPRCHEGDLFLKPGEKDYNIFGFTPKFCNTCGQSFFLEPGFYYGAMYMSYMFSVGLALPQFLLYYAVFDFSFRNSLLILVLILLLLTPYIYKISRALWINFFVHYQPDAVLKYQSKNTHK